MSAVTMESRMIDQFMLGDPRLHARFSLAIELLTSLGMVTSRTMTASRLAEEAGQPLCVVRRLLTELVQSGLVCRDKKIKDAWLCVNALSDITLADIFQCIVSAGPGIVTPRKLKTSVPMITAPRTAAQQSADLLLMQATMAVNQVVLQYLQTFDLGRLRAVASATPFRILNRSLQSYVAQSQ